MPESRLFKPLQVGNVTLQHRIALAPLTRFRADDKHVPLPFVKDYYAQRGSVPGTLLVSEATLISPQAGGYSSVPGIWSQEQIAAWKQVTKAVHENGSFIFLQLWALGRVAMPEELRKEGFKVKSASAVPAEDGAPVPEAMTQEDIQSFVRDFAQAGRNAIEAGFDGVEIHGANGYLVDQFLHDCSNQRTDDYGGSEVNRSRFAVEVVDALVDAIGAKRVAIRLSPWSDFQGMKIADPIPQFTDIIEKLSQKGLAYLHLVEPRVQGITDIETSATLDFAVKAWNRASPLLLAGGYTPEIARKVVDEERKDQDIVVVFGRYFISTPDLPFRLKHGLPLTPYDRSKFYNTGETSGYIDWPFSEEFTKDVKA
ncbi:NADPH dehydrogenase [Camillea tinctor]|nr:NADPH dehydrogenase [Camillea tinctor]